MKVREIMQREPRTVEQDAPAIHALSQMLWTGIRHLPVVDGGRLVGVVSERDLLASRSDEERLYGDAGDRVADVMSTPPRFTHPNADVADAAAELSVHGVGCLPVVDAGRVVGIVTTRDLLAVQAQIPVALPEPETRTAADVMSRDLLAVSPEDRLVDAVAELTQRGVRHLPVVDGMHRVVGILSDRDVREALGSVAAAFSESLEARVSALRVSDAMTPDPRTVGRDEPLSGVVHVLLHDRVGALPVVDDEEVLVGLISYVDVLRALAGEPRRALVAVTAGPSRA